MKYSIEIGKIVEGALKHDQVKVLNYTRQLIAKLEEDKEERAVNKFTKLLTMQQESTLSAMGTTNNNNIPVDAESRTTLADVIYPNENNIEVVLSQSNLDKLNSFILSYKNSDTLNSLGLGVQTHCCSMVLLGVGKQSVHISLLRN